MGKRILNPWGGEFEYSAPTLDILTVQVEQGFAKTGTPDPVYDDSEGTEGSGYDDIPGYF